MALLVAVDVQVPHRDCAAFGQLRARAIDALVLDQPGEVPAGAHAEITAWAAEALAGARGPARGVAIDGLPAAWFAALAWSGTPLARDGALRWGVDVLEGGGERPVVDGSRVLLPPCDLLAELSAPAIKPLREWVAQRLHCRLQSAPGVRLWVWENLALCVSCLDVPVGGFLYGPTPGSRASLSLPPGGAQLVPW